MVEYESGLPQPGGVLQRDRLAHPPATCSIQGSESRADRQSCLSGSMHDLVSLARRAALEGNFVIGRSCARGWAAEPPPAGCLGQHVLPQKFGRLPPLLVQRLKPIQLGW